MEKGTLEQDLKMMRAWAWKRAKQAEGIAIAKSLRLQYTTCTEAGSEWAKGTRVRGEEVSAHGLLGYC